MQTIEEKGLLGEQTFCRWLDDNSLGYVHLNQDFETFAKLFQGSLKRPDFFVHA